MPFIAKMSSPGGRDPLLWELPRAPARDLWQTKVMPYWFDGNNLIGRSASAAKADPRVRKEFLSTLSACQKAGGGRFLVYFDGDDPGGLRTPPGISIRYSAPLSTDETILRRLREIGSPQEVIVVTNDRDLTTRCRLAGARVMNWLQFAARMDARLRRHDAQGAADEKIDVDEWLRYFGVDKNPR